MALLYSVSASLEWQDGEWTCSRQLPTFLLNANIQGIRDCADAEAIVRKICGGPDGCQVKVHASAVAWQEV